MMAEPVLPVCCALAALFVPLCTISMPSLGGGRGTSLNLDATWEAYVECTIQRLILVVVRRTMRHSSPFGRISKGHVSARPGRVGDWRTAARPKAIPQSQNSRCRCRPFCRPGRPITASPLLRPLRNTHTATVTGGPPGIPGRYERAIMLPLGALLATGLRGCGWTRRGGHRAPEPSHDRRRRPPSPLRTARLQNGIINQGQLVAAFQAWTLDKSRSLADHLEARGDLTLAKRALFDTCSENRRQPSPMGVPVPVECDAERDCLCRGAFGLPTSTD